jgi:N-acetylated-alpha-linked acidic dipeptidase
MSFCLPKYEAELEKKFMAEYSREEVQRNHRALVSIGERTTGKEGERKAVQHISEKMKEYGIPVEVHEFETLVSYGDLTAKVEVLEPERMSISAYGMAFSASTPTQGIEGELVHCGSGFPKELKEAGAKGKIVVLTHGGMGEKLSSIEQMKFAEEAGAVATILIHDVPGVLWIGPSAGHWGRPSVGSKLPAIPSLSIKLEDGKRLTQLTANQRVRVRVESHSLSNWKKVLLPVATIRGTDEPDKFILLAGHHCSWFDGACDNAGGNAASMELARVLSKLTKNLRRSVKVAWWPAHSMGAYSGSTWFIDNMWDDVNKNQVAFFSIDMIAEKGADMYAHKGAGELTEFLRRNVRDATGHDVALSPLQKLGDWSFFGVGVPGASARQAYSPDAVERSGRNRVDFWWHTTEDTLDKLDIDLVRPMFEYYGLNLLRMANSVPLPFNFTTVADQFLSKLQQHQADGNERLDLSPLVKKARALRSAAAKFERSKKRLVMKYSRSRSISVKKNLEIALKETDTDMMRMSRILNPVYYTIAGKYDQDSYGTWYLRPIALLNAMKELGSADPDGWEYKTLLTTLVRRRNQIGDALKEAAEIAERSTQRLSSVA